MVHRRLRRLGAGIAIVGGALLMWLSPATLSGALMLAAGIAIELVASGRPEGEAIRIAIARAKRWAASARRGSHGGR